MKFSFPLFALPLAVSPPLFCDMCCTRLYLSQLLCCQTSLSCPIPQHSHFKFSVCLLSGGSYHGESPLSPHFPLRSSGAILSCLSLFAVELMFAGSTSRLALRSLVPFSSAKGGGRVCSRKHPGGVVFGTNPMSGFQQRAIQ